MDSRSDGSGTVGLGAALAAFALLLLLRFAMLWLGIYLALALKSPQAVVAIQILVWPIGFFSNAFASPESMPAWLGAIAEWNPMSATVAATRELFGNPGWGGESWMAQHAILMAVVWPLVLMAIFFPLSVHRYHRLRRRPYHDRPSFFRSRQKKFEPNVEVGVPRSTHGQDAGGRPRLPGLLATHWASRAPDEGTRRCLRRRRGSGSTPRGRRPPSSTPRSSRGRGSSRRPGSGPAGLARRVRP